LPLLQGARGRVVDLSATVVLRSLAEEEGTQDPHVWFDPQNVAEWALAASDALSDLDPEQAALYAARAGVYNSELSALDAWIADRVAAIPLETRRLVTDHEALGYFADRYGFQEVGTVVPGTSTLSEPSARELAALEDAIRATHVPCVFVGTTAPSSLAEQVAADTGVRIVFLYTGSLSSPDGPAPSYLELMRYDVTQIVSGLLGTSG
jgi:ABC-type Zn uptake system ZnuABC Zn-binding protein ZnuA